jgi:hypothetical protein
MSNPNTHPTTRRSKSVRHRPAHWNWHEIKEAFVFWLGFEALLNLLNMFGFEVIHWLHEAMESELIPGFVMAFILFAIWTPASRYGIALAALKSYGQQLGQTILKLRVEEIIKSLSGHHMRTLILWAGGTACIHLTIGCAKAVLQRPAEGPVTRAPIGTVPQRKTLPPTSPNASHPAALVPINDQQLTRQQLY